MLVDLDDARPYAGGTAIQMLTATGGMRPVNLVDLSALDELTELAETGTGIRAGAMVTVRRMERDPLVRAAAPLAADAYAEVAHPRIRNAATVGGNLAFADHRLDPLAPLQVLDAFAEVASPDGSRRIAVRDLFAGDRRTVLAGGELIVAVEIPRQPTGRFRFVKHTSLSTSDWPCASAAVLLTDADSVLRVGLGAVAPTPVLLELPVPDGASTDELVEIARDVAGDRIHPIADVRGGVAYKTELALVALEEAVRGLDGPPPSHAVPVTARSRKHDDAADRPVGARWSRVDGHAKVRGELRYTAELPAPQCLDVAVHRSDRPHARIVGIDVDAALRSDGVVAVVTGADLHAALGDRLFTGPAFADQPPLAVDKVRYAGEPVVAVVAHGRAAARAAASRVVVEYADLEPVLDVDAAVAGGPYVHDELRPSAVFGDLRHLSGRRDTNVNYEFRLVHGDAEQAHTTSPTTVSGEFWCPPTHHVPIELPFTAAWPDGDRLCVQTATQTPSYVRQAVADLLDLPLNRVQVTVGPLGGGFGAKMYDRLEPLTAALAWRLRRPVRSEVTREEAFALTTRHGVAVTGSMSADEDGAITAASADVRYDTGAYADIGPRITAKSGMVATGPYRMNDAAIRSRCVYTNKPSAGPYRGFGVPQVTWAHESLVDDLARAYGEDPAAFRRRNLLREGDEAAVGTVMHSADFVGCLDAVTDAVGWDAPLPPSGRTLLRGRGVAVGVKAVLTPTISNAVLQLNQDGSATLAISTVDMGQGSDTIMAQIAADVLCLGEGRVRVMRTDTDITPYDTITAGSRSTYHTGNAVRRVAEGMRDRLLRLAADRFGVDAADVKLTDAGLTSTQTGETVGVAELVEGHFGARGTTLTTEASFVTEWTPYDKATGRSTQVTEHWFAGAAAAQLTVDTRTGRVHVERLAVAGDVGRAINPTLVEQQLTGAALMGLGQALFDELVLDEGRLANANLLQYQLPALSDVPDELTPIIVESPHRTGPFGAKGVGETALIPLAPAIANAVRDATGIRISRLPLTPERVRTALREAGR
ncbi:MAG: molybdopterin-dependent oxidoreductase [Streptosporangiales bacterium]|nr:molybdopterin-dependent oxidoreductase [Streptosporangiales bacterium]